jgi:hypothetical protein
MRRPLASILLLCALPMGAVTQAQAQAVSEFRNTLPIMTQGKDGLHRVELPAAVHQGMMRADMGDLRVFNANGEVLPFAFAGSRERVSAKPAAQVLPFFPQMQKAASSQTGGIDLQVKQLPDGTLVSLRTSPKGKAEPTMRVGAYLVDASKVKEPLAALELDWVVTDETRSGRLRVEASDDLQRWSTLASDAPLLDIEHGGERLSRKRVEFAAAKAKYLRLTFQREAFELKKLQVEGSAGTTQTDYRQLQFTATAGEKQGEYLFDLGGRLPVERVALELPQANTVAPTRILTRAGKEQPWRDAGSATFYRLTRDGVELTSPAAALYGSAERNVLLRVDSRSGGLGVGMPKLIVEWQPSSIVFAARGEGPYRLAYGNPNAHPSSLVLTQLMPGYEPGREYALPAAKTGDPVAQGVTEPGVVETVVKKAGTKQGVLWLVLLAGVALLGWMAWKLGRQLGVDQRGAEQQAAKKAEPGA